MRPVLVVGALALATGGTSCGQAPADTTVASQPQKPDGKDSSDQDESEVKRVPTPTSPDLKITIEPKSGPPGTVIRIAVTGCNDPDGRNHAVSFNNDSEDFAVRFDPETVRTIDSKQDGERLDAEYTVVDGDATGGVGRIYVQCSDGLATAEFTVTN